VSLNRYTCVCAGPKKSSCILVVEASNATAAGELGAAAAHDELGGAWWTVAVLAVGSVDMLTSEGVAGHHGLIARKAKP
jgi:hypothetical protein